MKRTLWISGVLLGAIVAGYLYLVLVRDPWVRQVAALEASRDSLNQSVAALTARASARAARDTALTQTVIRVRVRVDTLIVRATVAESIFVERLPDSLVAPFRAVIAVKDSVIAGLTRIIDTQEQRLALRDTSLTETRAALAEALAQRDRWRKQARPSLVIRLLRAGPTVAVAAGLGYLLGRR